MESLFKLTELETRFSLNMNILSGGQIPNVLGLRDVLQQWLEHRVDVLVRRSKFRLERIEHRLEVLDGYLIAYLKIDEVIRIVRHEDEPKAKLIAKFKLSDVQAEAILNLRLKSLSRLQEIEIKAEHEKLSGERRDLKKLLKSDELQWQRIADEVKDIRKTYAKTTELGRRRTEIGIAPDIDVDFDQVFVEREPITVILSEKGWVRALKGHQDNLSKLDFKRSDKLKSAVKAHTTDKLIVFATNGRFYTLECSQLPGGRGHGEPLRLMVDLEQNHEFLTTFVHDPERRLLVASSAGYGFVVPEAEVVAATRKGKQVLNVSSPDEACVCVPVQGEHVAVIGENRKMLVFWLGELNEMTRGKGNMLQRYKDGGLSDIRVFEKDNGLTWIDAAGRTYTLAWKELGDWIGKRAQAGRMAPKGFPRSNKFGDPF